MNQEMKEEMSYEESSGADSEGSFWAIKGYAATANRVSAGNSLTDQLVNMLKERSQIEVEYASSLHAFSDKWSQKIGEGKEYGTMEGAWKAVFVEAERTSVIHYRIRERLVNDIITDIKNWQKEHYKRTLMGLKERKDIDSYFDKAQRPWVKRLEKMNKAKTEYHTKCRMLRTAEIVEKNQQTDTSVSIDQKRKNQAKIEELATQRDKTREKYEQGLRELTDYNARYMEDMTEVFNKCQTMEAVRHSFFKESFLKVHGSLDISDEQELPDIYADLHQRISTADSEKDLEWWSMSHGVDMPIVWPSYEEWLPNQVNTLQRKTNRKPKDGGITLIGMRQGESPNNIDVEHKTSTENNNPRNGTGKPPTSPLNRRESTTQPISNGDYENMAGESFDEFDSGFNYHKVGVRVRAIYDYKGDEDDELTFTTGMEFEKIEERDDQGWCKGKLNGKVGLYPANFCEQV